MAKEAAAGIDDALELVTSKFKGMQDKDGEPYILHCLRVMLGVSDPLAQQVAVMHDLVEDTSVTLDELRLHGFAEDVIAAVDLVTHRDHESYADYVVKLKPNTLARQAKLSDLRDNAGLDRVLYRERSAQRDANRIQRYVLSYQFLSDRIDEPTYRRQMSAVEEN